MKRDQKYNTLIADSQFLTGKALEMIIRESDEYIFVGSATNYHELEQIPGSSKTDLIITDFRINGCSNLNQIAVLLSKYPGLRILFLTNGITRSELTELNNIGIENIIYKSATKNELLTAMSSAVNHNKFYSPEIYELLIKGNELKSANSKTLTATETEIVRLIASGLTTKEIATKRNVSFHTVMAHRKNIFIKLGVNNISELVVYAIKTGLIDGIEYYI
jgi:DNA-binding NarL/FixJ family response regulator